MTLTRQEAFETAKANHKARMSLPLAEGAFMASEEEERRFGFRHGWYLIAGFSFSTEEVTGQPYDMHQGGWAWV